MLSPSQSLLCLDNRRPPTGALLGRDVPRPVRRPRVRPRCPEPRAVRFLSSPPTGGGGEREVEATITSKNGSTYYEIGLFQRERTFQCCGTSASPTRRPANPTFQEALLNPRADDHDDLPNLTVSLGNALDLVLLLDSVRVRAPLGGVDELISLRDRNMRMQKVVAASPLSVPCRHDIRSMRTNAIAERPAHQALGDGLDVTEGGLAGASGNEEDGLVHAAERRNIHSLRSNKCVNS